MMKRGIEPLLGSLPGSLEQWLGTLVAEGSGHAETELAGILARACQGGSDVGTAVGVEDSRIEGKLTGFVTVDVNIDITSPGGHGDQAATFQLGQRGPFRQDGAVGGRIVERQQQRAGRRVLDAALDAREPPALRPAESLEAPAAG